MEHTLTMDHSEYVKLSQMEDKHWWFVGMKAIAARLLGRIDRTKGTRRILDAGCGTGGTLTWLNEIDTAYGIDRHALAVSLAKDKGQRRLARAAVEGLPFGEATFDVVTSFDVLYHLDVLDDSAALREFARVLVPGGLLLLRLPALEWLSGSPHDRAVHTRHRYTRNEVVGKLRDARMDVLRVTYIDTILFLPAILWRLFGKTVGSSQISDVRLPMPIINRLCAILLHVEALTLDYVNLPIGLSVFGVARKRTT